MAKDNTIDNFFSDALADHEWLEANDKVNAPFANHVPWEAHDPLAIMWMPGSPNADVTVTTPTGDKETTTMDGNLVTETPDGKLSVKNQDGIKMDVKDRKMVAKVATVINEIKRQFMLGRDLAHVKAAVIDRLTPEVKIAAKDAIVKLAREYPLIGSVYIETAPFATDNGVKGCESGAALLKNNQSKMAIFAVKMAKCGGCAYNRGGNCGLYKKALVSEVKYDERTLDHYQRHLSMARKVASDQKISSKEELKAALLGVAPEARVATSVVYHDQSKLDASREASTPIVETTESKEKRLIAKDLSLKLASGTSPEMFKEYIAQKYAVQVSMYPEVFHRYASFIGSLGSVFVELAPFQSVYDAAQYYKRHAQHVPYVLTDGRRVSVGDQKMLGKKLVASLKEIPMESWVKNLRGKAFNANELKQNPLVVTKKAFLSAPPTVKKASVPDQLWGLDQPLNDVIGEKFMTKNANVSTHKVQKEFKRAKVAEKTSSDNVTLKDGKLSIKADKGLEIEIGESDLDASIKKYL